MDYIPRPKAQRVTQDIEELLELSMESLNTAPGDAERRQAMHYALLNAYEAGVNAQRAVLLRPPPTPLPPE